LKGIERDDYELDTLIEQVGPGKRWTATALAKGSNLGSDDDDD
jgi:hypothetical protein